MSGPSVVTEQLASSRAREGRFWESTLSDYWALTKPEVNFLILITTGVGFYLGCGSEARPLSFLGLFNTLLGTLLVASGTGTLNQYFERKFDAQMRRTSRRPLAAGRLEPSAVLAFGILLSVAGCIYLATAAGMLASLLALLTLLSYLFLYTPLKRRTPLCVLVGAFPGAMPPLIGWAAASGSVSLGGWILFAILFFWQFPHFMAIAWMYREDYGRAGILMLPVVDKKGDATFRQIVVTSTILVWVSVLPSLMGMTGLPYFFGALALGMFLLQVSLWANRSRTNNRAKWLMHATVAHIPILLAWMIIDKLS
jgi:protoheme IX farnesyltransferase